MFVSVAVVAILVEKTKTFDFADTGAAPPVQLAAVAKLLSEVPFVQV